MNKTFLTPLVVEPTSANRNGYQIWEVVAPFECRVKANGKEVDVEIPQGFLTDFATTPRVVWSIFPPWGKYGKASVLHDYLYTYKLFDRKTSDKIFEQAMKDSGVSWLRRKIVYYAVRLFGAKHYRR